MQHQITISTAEGFADVRFPISEVSFAHDGSTRIVVEAVYKLRRVAFELVVRGHMRPGIVNGELDMTAFYREGIVLRPKMGCEIAELFAGVYSVHPEFTMPIPQLDWTCFALSGNPMNIDSEHINFKVFHDDDETLGLYFEMYIHVDLPCRYVRFDEKDAEYRPAIVSAFAGLSGIASYLNQS